MSAQPSLMPLPAAAGGKGVKMSPGVLALIGQTVDSRYRIRGVIGEGGMGAVYEAEQMPLGRRVALKVLHPGNAQKPEAVKRFEHEARVVSSIGHPNICELYDVGKLPDGAPYLVMERMHGDTLADRIQREGALPFDDVLEVLLQILGALGAAHRKGVVHRDVKPENIFLARLSGSSESIAKLLDFGISKMSSLDADLHLTRTGMVMGTPYYMAPEQARGDKIDHRVDLYATGVILYEALTGRRPFVAPNYNALLVQILSGKVKPLRSLRPALPEAFEAVAAKALQRNPNARFQSAAEFHETLARLRIELRRAPQPSRPDLAPTTSAPAATAAALARGSKPDLGSQTPSGDGYTSPYDRKAVLPEPPSGAPRAAPVARPPTARPAARPIARPATPSPFPIGASGLPRFGDEASQQMPFITISPSMLVLDTPTEGRGDASAFEEATQVAPPPVVEPPPVPARPSPPAVPAHAAPPVPPPPPLPVRTSTPAAPPAPPAPRVRPAAGLPAPAPRSSRTPRPVDVEQTVQSSPLDADEAEEIIRAARNRTAAARASTARVTPRPPITSVAELHNPARPPAPPPVPRAPRPPAVPDVSPDAPTPVAPAARVPAVPSARSSRGKTAQPYPSAPVRRPPLPMSDERDDEPTRLYRPEDARKALADAEKARKRLGAARLFAARLFAARAGSLRGWLVVLATRGEGSEGLRAPRAPAARGTGASEPAPAPLASPRPAIRGWSRGPSLPLAVWLDCRPRPAGAGPRPLVLPIRAENGLEDSGYERKTSLTPGPSPTPRRGERDDSSETESILRFSLSSSPLPAAQGEGPGVGSRATSFPARPGRFGGAGDPRLRSRRGAGCAETVSAG